MDSDEQTAQRLVNRLLYVCLYSGFREMGIGKIMDENREFLEAYLGRSQTFTTTPPPCECYPWMERIIQDHDLFFESLLAALRLSFPDAGKDPCFSPRLPRRWRGRYHADEILWSELWMNRTGVQVPDPGSLQDCHARVMCVAVPWLSLRLEENRRLIEFVSTYPAAINPGAIAWLEDITFFFWDVWEALELDEYYRQHPERRRSNCFWELKEGQMRQTWLELKARREDASFRRTGAQHTDHK